MRTHQIAVLAGDGIGPEVIGVAMRVLRAAEGKAGGFRLEMTEFPAGAGEYLKNGEAMPPETLEAAGASDAILLGAMGLPSVRRPNGTEIAPQLDLREKLELYAGVRPIRLYHERDTPLKRRGAGEIDFVIYRENTEGMFWSRQRAWRAGEDEVIDQLRISRGASERLFRAAFQAAEKRRGLVTLVDKSNVLPSMAFFRRVFDEVSEEFPAVRAERVYVDAAALYLVQRPEKFDVMVTENLCGDILSDLAAGLAGGVGMAPSGDIGDRRAVFQPAHGSAPDIAGRGIANPTVAVLSAAMMLEWLGEAAAGAAIRRAVERVFADPELRTPDLGGTLGTVEMTDYLVEAI